MEEQRGKGFAKHLSENILASTELKGVERWKLSTEDAHGLYEQLGFEKLAKNGNMMERILSGN
ncbi:GNAT family N-acetyltransferase [Algoriphagus sp. PAP.12]|uniref:GNAT family N-acetyltransferase n=1 Tax=Algoriphagus sp. PAP.12 TaxID=2996678 RepID=UPI00227D5AF9|nr:GNAT family N-acetyltransferase [Algoriphagus sp. PAP.12]